MTLNTEEKIRLGMAFNNAATMLARVWDGLDGEGMNALENTVYRDLVRTLYKLYEEEVKRLEDKLDEEGRKNAEIAKKSRLEVETEFGQTG